MEVLIGNSVELIQQAQTIRRQVFTIEQNIPEELDLDGLDSVAEHALVIDGNQPIATARLVINPDASAGMARIAVLETYRGNGIACLMINALIEHAKQRDISFIDIHAHLYLQGYYKKFGFEFIQQVEVVGEHQLIEMRLPLKCAKNTHKG